MINDIFTERNVSNIKSPLNWARKKRRPINHLQPLWNSHRRPKQKKIRELCKNSQILETLRNIKLYYLS